MVHKVLITDLDDTLYSWVDFFSPCFRAMVHVISQNTGMDEDTIIADFKKVYSHHRSLEYTYVVQELELVKNLTFTEKDKLVSLAHHVFGVTRRKHLKSYGTVKETFDWLLKSHIQIIAFSNAPIHVARGRLKLLGLWKYLEGLIAYEGYHVPTFDTSNEYLKSNLNLKTKTWEESEEISESKNIWKLKEEELKPSPTGYIKILDELGISPEEMCIVGDSLYKDIAPAKELGISTVHVNYKNTYPVNKKNLDTLFQVTHWSGEKIEKVYEENSLQADFEITKFEELKNILKPPQRSLFTY